MENGQNPSKRLAAMLASVLLAFSPGTKSVQAEELGTSIMQTQETANSFETEQDFIEYLQSQFRKDTLRLKENADRYIESIYINNHKVTLKLTSGKTFTKTLKYFDINGITVNALWVLNTESQSYKDSLFCNITNVAVKKEFKTDDKSISPNENVNLDSCEAIWLDNCSLLIQGRNSWQGIFNSDSLKHLIITNSHLSTDFAAEEDPIFLNLNTKNLETFILTGANSPIINIYFSNPEKLRTAIYGDNTRIRDLYGLKGATNLSYYEPGIAINNDSFDKLSIPSLLNSLPESKNTIHHTNIISGIEQLSNTQIPTLQLEEFPHATDYMSLLRESDSIRSVTGTVKYCFTSKELEELDNLGIQYPEGNVQYAKELDEIKALVNEELLDYDKVKVVIREYFKRNKLEDYMLKYENCLDLIQLFKKCNIEAYRIRNDRFDEDISDIIVVVGNDILFLDINKFRFFIETQIWDLAVEFHNENATIGETIDQYWENIIERIDIEDFITETLPENRRNEFFIYNNIILPLNLIEYIKNGKVNKSENNKSVFISQSVAGVKQSGLNIKDCMSQKMRNRFKAQLKPDIASSSTSSPINPNSYKLSSHDEAQRKKTEYERGYRF